MNRVSEGLQFFFFFNKFIYLFIYLFLAVLGLRFCARAFSSCSKRGPLLVAVRGPLTIAASLVAEHRLQTRRLSSCGSRAHLLRGMWDLPRPGLEPASPALAGRLSTTAPPGKPGVAVFKTLSENVSWEDDIWIQAWVRYESKTKGRKNVPVTENPLCEVLRKEHGGHVGLGGGGSRCGEIEESRVDARDLMGLEDIVLVLVGHCNHWL